MEDSNLRRIPKQLIMGFGVILALIILIAIVSDRSSKNLIASAEHIEHTYEVIIEMDHLLSVLLDAETGQRGFIFTNRVEFLEPYHSAVKVFDKHLNDLMVLFLDNHRPIQLERLKAIEKLSKQKLAELAQTIELKKAGKEQELFELVVSGKGKQNMDEIRSFAEDFIKLEEELLDERHAKSIAAEKIQSIVSIGGTFLVILLSLGIIFLISVRIKAITVPITGIISSLGGASTELAATTDEHERIASQQAAAVSETSSSMDQLGTSAKRSSEQTETALTGAKYATEVAHNGGDVINKTTLAMEDIHEKSGLIGEQILLLSEQTGQIGDITRLVTDIAGQTNLLALNAAVEAARAGEHGKGFAVVATEIRKLADQSKKSAERINGLVAEIQKATDTTVMAVEQGSMSISDGTELANKASVMFSEIIDSLGNTFENLQQVSLNNKQQADAVKQVVEAMTHIKSGSQQTSSGISQTREGLKNIEASIQELQAKA